MKTILLGAALLLLPATGFAASHMEAKKDAAAPDAAMAAPAAAAALPKCTAKVQDSCDQSMTTEKNALSYYPADERDAGNNKLAAIDRKRAVAEPK